MIEHLIVARAAPPSSIPRVPRPPPFRPWRKLRAAWAAARKPARAQEACRC